MPSRANLSALVLDEPIAALGRAGVDPSSAPALREPKRVWSYGKLHEEVCRAAGALLRLGLSPGDRVALCMHDGVELAAALLGTVRAGLCAVPFPRTLRPRELRAALLDSGARAALCHADLAEQVVQSCRDAQALEHILSIGGTQPGLGDFAALCSAVDPLDEPAVPEHPALLLYTTSPDGRPQAHGYPHGAVLQAYERCAGAVGLQAEDRSFCAGPLSSSFGLLFGLLFPLRAGGVSYLLAEPGRRGRAVFDVLGAFRPTLFSATPTVYNQILHEYLEMSAPRPAYFRPVRHALCFAEPLPRNLERRLRGVFHIDVLSTYLCAESFGPVLMSSAGAARSGSCGKPLAGLELRVTSSEGRPAQPAEIGQLELRGPLPFGLWCGLTQRLLPPPDGWVTLPDRFFIDEDGFFFHVGRSDGLFKVQGRLVSPGEIEQVLLEHPAVWECAVVEDEDEDGLGMPKAHVVLNLGQQPCAALAQELMDFVKTHLSPHKAPRAVEFAQQLPRGSDGRVQRWRLRSRPPGAPISPPSGLLPIRLK